MKKFELSSAQDRNFFLLKITIGIGIVSRMFEFGLIQYNCACVDFKNTRKN